MLFIIVNALHVSSGFSAHQELKSVHAASGILSNLFAVTASGNNKQVGQTPGAACTGLSS
jgi:hypothetical protein